MSEPKPLPFEPKGRNARPKSSPKPSSKPSPRGAKTEGKGGTKSPQPSNPTERVVGIPQEVSDRMVRRAAFFCGIPTAMGFGSLVVSYIVISRHWLELPNTLVLLVSLGLTGLGVLGLSYGALSASWDTGRVGSLWGGEEFRKNLGYLVAAWRSQRAATSTTPASPKGEDDRPNTP
ncbi:MAG: photosystem II biosynthesis protein [Pseudanabaenaceae cyanobacterium]